VCQPQFKRVVVKLSGEALMGDQSYGIDSDTLALIAEEIKNVLDMGVESAIVVGGGNVFRGSDASAAGMDRATADYAGMLATIINALAVQDLLERKGVDTRVQTAIRMEELAEPFIRRRALRHLEKGRVVIFAGGTGNPFFTTDTAVALRAAEIGADAVLKATKVPGVFDADPSTSPDAKLLVRLTYMEVVEKGLRAMDTTAITMCMENDIPIRVFNLAKPGNIAAAVRGEAIGTRVH